MVGVLVVVGSAGTGAGAQPEAPKQPAAAEEAEPGETGEPLSLDSARSGKVSAQAVALRKAAQQGAPFCAVCEAAKKKLAALQQQERANRPPGTDVAVRPASNSVVVWRPGRWSIA